MTVSLPYESVVSVWDRAGGTDEDKRAGEVSSLTEIPCCVCLQYVMNHDYSPYIQLIYPS